MKILQRKKCQLGKQRLTAIYFLKNRTLQSLVNKISNVVSKCFSNLKKRNVYKIIFDFFFWGGGGLFLPQ